MKVYFLENLELDQWVWEPGLPCCVRRALPRGLSEEAVPGLGVGVD